MEKKREPGKDVCAQCGWLEKDHRHGYCYRESDESSDYFYHDRKFVSEESLNGKDYYRSFDGKIIIAPNPHEYEQRRLFTRT